MTAQYLLLRPHYLGSGWQPEGTTIVEGADIPLNWVPTLAVDPLTTDAVTAFYNAGPRHNSWEDLNFFGTMIRNQPVTYWVPFYALNAFQKGAFQLNAFQVIGGVQQWKLTGLGTSLPPRGDN
jgi:hypothetical protein